MKVICMYNWNTSLLIVVMLFQDNGDISDFSFSLFAYLIIFIMYYSGIKVHNLV